MIIIDPPSGWQYGFPKPFTKTEDQTLEEWLIEEGYPQKLIDEGMAKHCRYWENNGGGIILNTL